jgi:RNA polymerase sigma-70 factor (ECF subfamily)
MAHGLEKNVIARAVEGDDEAFTEIYEAHAARIMRHIVYLTGDYHAADELTNETFVNAWKVIHRYQDRGLPIEYWLLKIGHNLAVRYLKRRRLTKDIEEVTIEAEENSSPERLAELASEERTLREALLKLPDISRQVIIWRFLEGMSYDECGRMLGKSNGAIRVCQYRGLKHLRTILEAMDADLLPSPRSGLREPALAGPIASSSSAFPRASRRRSRQASSEVMST